jgi:hypothetical protein
MLPGPIATIRTLFIALLMVLCFGIQAVAHNGPPFRVITEQKVGPCIVSVWAHANIGTSPFFVMLKPLPGAQLPEDLKIEIAVQPVDKRIPERHYVALPDPKAGASQYTSEVTLDFEGAWRVRVLLESAAGNGEAAAIVGATPHGFGHWDLFLYALPFMALGLLPLGALVRRRRLASRNAHKEVSCS